LPSLAIDPRVSCGGQLYVVWDDSRFAGDIFNQAVSSTSTDAGRTWSAPHVVSIVTCNPAFTPKVDLNTAGKVAVTYYDARDVSATNTATLPTDLWLKTAPADGVQFAPDTHMAGSFDLIAAPNGAGFSWVSTRPSA
jgi:hypothetical protein